MQESAARLETASTPAEDGEKQTDMLNNMRQELVCGLGFGLSDVARCEGFGSAPMLKTVR